MTLRDFQKVTDEDTELCLVRVDTELGIWTIIDDMQVIDYLDTEIDHITVGDEVINLLYFEMILDYE